MKDRQYELYQRGKAVGIINTQTGRKHRLATMGVMDDYTAMKQRLQVLARKPGKLARQLPKTEPHSNKSVTELRPHNQDVKEPEMDIFGILQIGSGALDFLSMTQDAGARSTNEKTEASHSSASKEKSLSAKNNKSDLEIIVEARKAEMRKLRQEKQKSKSKAKVNTLRR